MSGLDVEKEVIIEVAIIVADLNFKIYDTYEAVVNQPQKYIDGMDDWNRKHHGDSGLIQKIPFGKTPEMVESEMCALLQKYYPGNLSKGARPVLAGNSIAQDRLFINKYFQKFNSLLHYRMLDVTSLKIVMNMKYGIKYEKKNQHRALDDIRESMAELQHYTSHIHV